MARNAKSLNITLVQIKWNGEPATMVGVAAALHFQEAIGFTHSYEPFFLQPMVPPFKSRKFFNNP